MKTRNSVEEYHGLGQFAPLTDERNRINGHPALPSLNDGLRLCRNMFYFKRICIMIQGVSACHLMLKNPIRVTLMPLKKYIIAPTIHYGIISYLKIFAMLRPLRRKLYGEGERRRIYFSRDALKRVGITPSKLCAFFHLPLLSAVEVSELNQAAQEYQAKYGAASLKKAGREQGRFFVRKGFLRGITPEIPFTAHRFLMNCFSLFIGAKDYMGRVEMGRYAEYHYPEKDFPFELDDGKIVPGEKYFWTFVQGVVSADRCHNKQMRAEVTRKNKKVHVVSKSVEEWGDYLLDHIDKMF